MNGKDLKKWREFLKLKKYDAATLLGVERRTIGRWEDRINNHKPIPEKAKEACKYELTRQFPFLFN